MFVCVCNALTTSHVNNAIQSGACTPDCVHANNNSIPRCCCCFDQIDELIQKNMLQNPCGVGILHQPSESSNK